ncbi:MAG TPA: class I SAM-dependent methyltransferase [Rhizomicrobium sp.]
MSDREASRLTFDDEDVARCYAHRPPYAPAAYAFLAALVPQRRVLVDLGCGTGKVAAALAGHFSNVIAIDPAVAMIEAARKIHGHDNIRWLQARAEDVELPDTIDLVTAGTSIHWMAHDVLFPKLAERTDVVAVIVGDAPQNPPWQVEWRAAMTTWLARVHHETYDEPSFVADGRRFEPWVDIAGRRSFSFSFRQSVEDYIACQHSRASWARARIGGALSDAFDRDLEALLRPWARDGMLTMELTSDLTWGTPRRTPRP